MMNFPQQGQLPAAQQQQQPQQDPNDVGREGMLTWGASYFDQQKPNHGDNLADFLPESVLQDIGGQLKTAIQEDYESAQPWRSALANALKLLDTRPTTQNWPFPGASGYVSDAFARCFLRVTNTIMAEVWPIQGCVKAHLQDESDETLEMSERLIKFFEYYFSEINPEFRQDKHQMTMWGALSGSVFSKVYDDPVLNRPHVRYVKAQKDLIVNQGTRSLETATRITHRFTLSERELQAYQASGQYRKIDIGFSQMEMSDNKLDKSLNKLMGQTPQPVMNSNLDKEYSIDECHTYWNIPGFDHVDIYGKKTGIQLPYRITQDRESGRILSIYANWDEGDPYFHPIEWFVHYGLLGGLGFYQFGLTHMTAGSAESATRMGRQIENAATLANFPAGFRSKTTRLENTEITLAPLTFSPIETMGGKVEDNISMLPFRDPSPALIDGKQKAEEAIEKMMGVIETQFSDMNPNSPVGTTLAMLEELHQTQAAYVRSYHSAFQKELKLLTRLFKKRLGDEIYPFPTKGGQFSIKQDMIDSIQIIPVSNPNLSTTAQRLVQNEGLMKLAAQSPDMYDMYEINKRMLQEMKVPEMEKVLKAPPPPQPPLSTDPLNENSVMLVGGQVAVTFGQDHDAHAIVHQQLLEEMQARFAANPQDLEALAVIKAVEIHSNEHKYYKYGEHIMEQIQQSGGQVSQDLLQQIQQLPMEIQNEIARSAAAAIQMQKQEEMQANANAGGAPDPNATYAKEVEIKGRQVEIEAQMKSVQADNERMRLELDMQRLEIEKAKMELENERKMQQLQLEMAKLSDKQRFDQEKLDDQRSLDMVKVMKEQKEMSLKEAEKQWNAAKDMHQMELSERELVERSRMGNEDENEKPKK